MTRCAHTVLSSLGLLLLLASMVAASAQSLQDQREELVVIVSIQNPVNSLTRSQVEDIFLGRTPDFPDGRRARPIDQAEGSAVRNLFNELVLMRTASQVRSHWSRIVFTGNGRPPRTLDSNEQVVRMVSDDANAIGYVERQFLNDAVKVVLK